MRAAQNVISNGVDYCPPGTCLRITAETIRTGRRNSGRSRLRTAARDLPGRCCCMEPSSFTRGIKAAPARIITGWDCILPGRSWNTRSSVLCLENAPEAGGQVRMGVPVEAG